ncbi:MAG: twin-arginine translocase subunit TatC [Candidatus Puniceispirillales bacterium]
MNDKDSPTEDQGTMPLLEHLTELRNRLGLCVAVFVVLFIGCLVRPFGSDSQNIADIVYLFLQQPLADILREQGGRMIFTALHEAFFTQIKVAFFTALFVAFPIILLQVWRFVAPGLYQSEKKAFLPFLMATPILFFLGGAMVYYLVIPLAWDFFLSFQISGGDQSLSIEVEPRISEYLSLVMRLIFAFGLSFELPVVLLLMAKAGLVTSRGLAEKRKYAILLSFVAAAILTPPDVISQVMLAVPIIFLYEISIIASRILVKPPEYDDEDDN